MVVTLSSCVFCGPSCSSSCSGSCSCSGSSTYHGCLPRLAPDGRGGLEIGGNLSLAGMSLNIMTVWWWLMFNWSLSWVASAEREKGADELASRIVICISKGLQVTNYLNWSLPRTLLSRSLGFSVRLENIWKTFLPIPPAGSKMLPHIPLLNSTSPLSPPSPQNSFSNLPTPILCL